MLPRDTTVRQLKKLRALTKGTDIGDLTANDRLNSQIPNLQKIGNPVDTGIDSYEEFAAKDSKIQTIAFKSKLVNKNIKEGFMTNIATGAMMTAETLASMSASSANGKPEHTITQSQEKTELEVMQEVKSDMKNYYAYGSGQSPDISTAKKIAISNAKIKISKEIGTNKNFTSEIKRELITISPNGGYIYHVVLSSPRELKENNEFLENRSINTHDIVIAKLKIRNIPKGSSGTVVYVDHDWGAYEVEFIVNGSPVVETVPFNQIEKIKENNQEIMEKIENVLKFDDFDKTLKVEKPKKTRRTEVAKDVIKEKFEDIKTLESFSVSAAKKEEKQPEYTILGQEKELKSNPNFGVGAVKDNEIKKITSFNVIDPPTPKERSIGGSAGVFIDNDIVQGYVNRIEGKDVYVESLDEPMVIKKFSLKDSVKTKKEN